MVKLSIGYKENHTAGSPCLLIDPAVINSSKGTEFNKLMVFREFVVNYTVRVRTNPIVDILAIYFQQAPGTILIEVHLTPIGFCGFPFKISQFGLLAIFINESGKGPVGPITCKRVASIGYCQVEIIRTFNFCFKIDRMPLGFPSD